MIKSKKRSTLSLSALVGVLNLVRQLLRFRASRNERHSVLHSRLLDKFSSEPQSHHGKAVVAAAGVVAIGAGTAAVVANREKVRSVVEDKLESLHEHARSDGVEGAAMRAGQSGIAVAVDSAASDGHTDAAHIATSGVVGATKQAVKEKVGKQVSERIVQPIKHKVITWGIVGFVAVTVYLLLIMVAGLTIYDAISSKP